MLSLYLRPAAVHRGEQGGQRAGVRLAEEGGVQGCRGDGAQESRRYLRVHLGGSVDGRLQRVRGQRAGVRLGCLQPRDGGVSARELGGQRRGGDGPQESVGTLVSTSSGVIPPLCPGSAGPPPS